MHTHKNQLSAMLLLFLLQGVSHKWTPPAPGSGKIFHVSFAGIGCSSGGSTTATRCIISFFLATR